MHVSSRRSRRSHGLFIIFFSSVRISFALDLFLCCVCVCGIDECSSESIRIHWIVLTNYETIVINNNRPFCKWDRLMCVPSNRSGFVLIAIGLPVGEFMIHANEIIASHTPKSIAFISSWCCKVHLPILSSFTKYCYSISQFQFLIRGVSIGLLSYIAWAACESEREKYQEKWKKKNKEQKK